MHYGYHYDTVSTIQQIDDLRPGSVHGAGDARRNSQRFEYDDLYRLTRVAYSLSVPGDDAAFEDGYVSYGYDRIGNMVRRESDFEHQLDGVPLVNSGAMAYGGEGGSWGRGPRESGDSPGPHAVSRVGAGEAERSFVYDDNGNLSGFARDGIDL